MRILHFADLHLGVENYGRPDPATGLSSRLLDTLRALDELVEYAVEERVDLVLFAGDAYKSRDPSQTQQREFARRIRRLVEAGITVFLLVGNHDLPNAIGRASALEIFDTLGVQRVYVGDRPQTYRVQTPGGDVQVVAVPWLTPSRVLGREQYKNLTIDELHRLMEARTEEFIRGEAERLDADVPAVLAAHLSLSGTKVKSGSERAMTVGNYPSFSLSSLHPQAFDYVALGHHHPHQVLSASGGTPVVYAGSMQRVDFGEEGDDKGFYTVVIDADKGRGGRCAGEPQFHPVAARRFATVEVTPRETDPTPEVLRAVARAGVGDAIVRLILHLTPQQADLLGEGEVRRALAEAHYLAGIQRDVQRQPRRRLPPQVRLEAMSVLDQLGLYLKEKGTPADRLELMLRYARDLVQSEKE